MIFLLMWGVAEAKKEDQWSLFPFLMALKYEDCAALAEARRAASKRSCFEDRRPELLAFLSIDNSSDQQGLERYVTLFSRVSIAKRDVTVPRLVPNQVFRERVRRREGGRVRDSCIFQGEFQRAPVSQGPVRGWGASAEQGGFKGEQDRDVVGAGRGEGVGPLCKIRCKERAGKG